MLNINKEVIEKAIAFKPSDDESLYSDEVNNIFYHYMKKNMTYDEALSYMLETILLSFRLGVMRGKGAI